MKKTTNHHRQWIAYHGCLFGCLCLGVAICVLVYKSASRKDIERNSPYLCACVAIDNDSVAELENVLKTAPDLTSVRDGFDRSTLLHRVSASSHILRNCEELAKCLISHGADINAVDCTGSTPLMLALQFSAPSNYLDYLRQVSLQSNELKQKAEGNIIP